MRFLMVLCLFCVVTSRCLAAAEDITISNAQTPETTPATIGSAVIVGTVSGVNFHNGFSIYFNVAETDRWVINNTTGVLSRKAGFEINFETHTSLTATVTAEDPITTVTVIKAFTITITDVNERPTMVSFVTGGSVVENVAATVGNLTANDPENGTLTYATTDPRFTITGNTLSVLANQLDFETTPTTTVAIQVTDSGPDSGTVTLTLPVSVTNVNEPPTAVSFASGGFINENSTGSVGTLQATDPDAGDNVTFSTTDPRFQIAGSTLSLKSGNAFDFEVTPSTTLTITVRDIASLTTDSTVTVIINNVNEAPGPVTFASGGSVAENAAATVGTLTANDPENGTLTFTTTDSRYTISGNTLSVLANQLNFEAKPTTLTITARSDKGLTSDSIIPITVTDQNDIPTLGTWNLTTLQFIDASKNLPLVLMTDTLSEEDTKADFITYVDYKLEVSFALVRKDTLEFVVPSDLQGDYSLDNGTGKVFRRGDSTLIATMQISESTTQTSTPVKTISATIVVKTASSLVELQNLLRMVTLKPDQTNIANRGALTINLRITDPKTTPPWTSDRTITLNTANQPPTIEPVDKIKVTRFGRVNITPTMLGIKDDHSELGLTLFIDYQTLNGNLYTSSQPEKLKTGQSVLVNFIGPNKDNLTLDLFYVPDTDQTSTADACFLSVRDNGSVKNGNPVTFLRTKPVIVSFEIEIGAVPKLTGIKPSVDFTEGDAAVTIVSQETDVVLKGPDDLATANLGGWNLYVSYSSLNSTTGPGSLTETLAVRSQSGITVDGDGRTIKLGGKKIAQIDAAATGVESALLLILSPDIVGSEVLMLAKALTYRDASPRLPMATADLISTRVLSLGFIEKNDATRMQDVQITVTKKAIDTPPVFTEGSQRTVITVSNVAVLGSSVLDDIDTVTTPLVSINPISGDVSKFTHRAIVAIQRGPEDTTKTYRTTLGWKLQRDPDVAGDQDFILLATIGSTKLSQTITLSPRNGSDLGLAIASDAPLALIKPSIAAKPITRALRVRRGPLAVENATFFLLGDTVPPWITIDSTAGTVSYDLAKSQAGATYRFSVLATAGTSAAEQPVVLRIVEQPVLSGTN